MKGRAGSVENARRMAKEKEATVILVRKEQMGSLPWHVEAMESFDDGVIDYEKFYFYRVTPPG